VVAVIDYGQDYDTTADLGTDLADLYQPIDWHELWATTSAEPDWLVPDIIERGRLHAIYAPRKHKKSLVTLVMVAALATGGPLFGRPNPHNRGLRVLYIDIENARDDIRQRLADAGYAPDDLANLAYFSFPSLPGLDSLSGAEHLLALVERHRPELLVLDTTSRVVTGKENDADTFRALYRYALAPVKARGVAVLRLDHAGKDVTLGQRGSSAKGDDLDTAWVVNVRGDTRITLRLDFQRTNHHPETVELLQRASPLRFIEKQPRSALTNARINELAEKLATAVGRLASEATRSPTPAPPPRRPNDSDDAHSGDNAGYRNRADVLLGSFAKGPVRSYSLSDLVSSHGTSDDGARDRVRNQDRLFGGRPLDG